MQNEERFVLTRAGYEQLKQELDSLETEQQEQLAEYSDVNYSANDPAKEEAAYFETRTSKEHTDERIGHLKLVLEHAEVVDDDPNPETIDPGDRVTVWDFSEKHTVQFDLLGSEEIIAGRQGISLESPVGKALHGKKVGDVVEVEVPDGIAKYAIRKIERIPGGE
jgi:transcription elongation factor GreA